MRFPKPWFRAARGVWYVTLNGVQVNLGADREAAFAQYKQMLNRPQQVAAPAGSVASVLDAFLEWYQKNRGQRTYEWYLQRCQWFTDSIPGDLTVDALRPFHLQQWVDGHPHWSNGHRRGCLIAIQRPFRWAAKLGLIDKNPVAYIEKPPAGQRDQIVTPSEFERLLTATRDAAFRDLLQAA